NWNFSLIHCFNHCITSIGINLSVSDFIFRIVASILSADNSLHGDTKMKIPKPIADFIEATNKHNSDEFLAVIAETALVHDEGHDYRGISEIKKWSDEKVFGAKVILEPIRIIEQRNNTIVRMKIDGNFDKTGLPDPFVMDFYFTIDSNKISRLSIRLPNHKMNYLDALGSWMI
ncbi:nuclear transport factor 2 family protein, partial [bacterium]|nr:nuclear transport factor 2 family protein [bacterium]